ncbi:hypothetical protein [Helicobacter turcicus]|uniref:hypothetical protein n=1 Tax=Helicobacter turcicus TaxID=2867412 RepID=UPI001F30762E|nr:hypothetical protein [Helicobacter turcicus]
MVCPLCYQNIQSKNSLFQLKDAFTLAGYVSIHSFTENKGGGGKIKHTKYGRGDKTITLTQCNHCGYLFNSSFNPTTSYKEYENYIPRKAVSKNMSANIKNISDEILRIIPKNSNCIEIAPGRGDLIFALINHINFMYSIDPSLSSLEIGQIKNLEHIKDFLATTPLNKKLPNLSTALYLDIYLNIFTPQKLS